MAGACGASSVLLTDVPDRMPLLEHNIELNEELKLSAKPLSWGPVQSDELKDTTFDVILCSDVLFNDTAIPLLVYSIQKLSKSGSICFSSCEHRWDGALQFYTLMEAEGFSVEHIQKEDHHPGYYHESVHVCKFTKK